MRLGSMGLTLRGGSFIGDGRLDEGVMAIAWRRRRHPGQHLRAFRPR